MSAPSSELFARVRSALGEASEQQVRGRAALEELEEQLEAAQQALQYIANQGIGSQATSNEHKAASMVVERMRHIAQSALNPATKSGQMREQGYA